MTWASWVVAVLAKIYKSFKFFLMIILSVPFLVHVKRSQKRANSGVH